MRKMSTLLLVILLASVGAGIAMEKTPALTLQDEEITQVRLTWDDDPKTTIVVMFQSSIAGSGKKMAQVLKVQSLNPKAMTSHYQFYRNIMFGKSSLSRAQREMIAIVVSAENGCYY